MRNQRGTRVRGYRISVQRERLAGHWPYESGDPVYWHPEGELPRQWSTLQHDPTILSARLVRSGRLFQTWTPESTGAQYEAKGGKRRRNTASR